MPDRFRITTEVVRINQDDFERKEASIGHTVEAESFKAAIPQFNEELNRQWGRVLEMAPIIDGEDPTEQKKNEVEVQLPDGSIVKAQVVPGQPLQLNVPDTPTTVDGEEQST